MKRFDFVAAGKRVGRDPRTIKRWRARCMPTIIRGGVRLLRDDVLLTTYRERLNAGPLHQYRMRAARVAQGEMVS